MSSAATVAPPPAAAATPSSSRYPLRSRSGKKDSGGGGGGSGGGSGESEAKRRGESKAAASSAADKSSDAMLAPRTKSPPTPRITTTAHVKAGKQDMRLSEAVKLQGIFRLTFWLAHVWKRYLFYLDTRPVLTKALTAGVISVISDLLAQWLLLDWSKCASFLSCVSWSSVRNQLIVGLVLRGAPVHFWYLFLTWMFRKYDGSTPRPHDKGDYERVSVKTPPPPPTPRTPQPPPGKGSAGEMETFPRQEPLWVTVSKVAVDQLTYGPFSTWIYFFVIGWLEGRSMASCQAAVERDFWPILVNNWKVWPLVTLINFKFVPLNLQVLFGNFVSIFWTTYVVMVTRV